MKSTLAALLLASATLGAGPVLFAPSAAQAADAEVSFDFFNDSLSPYGDWIEVGDYGLCWRPRDVDANWAPYTDGYWSYTDAGWTWVSYEDFGGVVYHYGRWVSVEDEGWCWVPDYEWGPAWVSWRNNDDYVGWAPLPPEARWEPEVGFSVWVDNSYDIGPSHYNFCSVEDFGAPVIREVILPRPRNVVIIQNTVNITNITVNRFAGVPFCGGPRYDFLISRVRRPIPALKLVRETNITNIYNNTVINNTVINNGRRGRALHAVQQGNQLIVPAPRVKRVANPLVAVPNLKPVRTVAAAKVNKGWDLVKDNTQREQIKQKFAQETKGLRRETAPARAVETAELKPVPEKGDPNAPSPVATGGRGKRNGKDGRETAAGFAPGEPAPGANAQPNQPTRQTADTDDNKPGKQGNGKGRGENAGIVPGNRGPLKPFNGGDAPNAGPGAQKPDTGEPQTAQQERLEKQRKDREQVSRAAEVQEEFRKRRQQQQQAQIERPQKPQGQDDNASRPDAAERVERQREAQAAAAEARKEQQARAAQQENAREQAAGDRAERMAERQREAQAAGLEKRREQQQSQAAEARREQQQQRQELLERRQQQAQGEAMEQRRQQAAAGAAQARREQMEAMQAQRQQAMRQQQMEAQRDAQKERNQAMRQQQLEAQRQMQAQRAEQAQRQMQQQQQQQPQRAQQGGNGKGGDGERRGRGKKDDDN
ncbi:DUF6600 domain-containing protein [Verrucomicrobiota bacterium sgz303538]